MSTTQTSFCIFLTFRLLEMPRAQFWSQDLKKMADPAIQIWVWVASFLGSLAQEGEIPPMASPIYGRLLTIVKLLGSQRVGTWVTIADHSSVDAWSSQPVVAKRLGSLRRSGIGYESGILVLPMLECSPQNVGKLSEISAQCAPEVRPRFHEANSSRALLGSQLKLLRVFSQDYFAGGKEYIEGV